MLYDQHESYFKTDPKLVVGRGDNLQLLISPLLKYEEWLYNIIDDKNFEINSQEPPCTGGLKIPHTPIGTCRNAKNENFEFCFDCGKDVFQWTKKNHLGHFDWNCLGSRYSMRPNTQNMASVAKSDAKGSKVVSQFNFKCHRDSFEVHWNTFWPKSIHNQNFHFLFFL